MIIIDAKVKWLTILCILLLEDGLTRVTAVQENSESDKLAPPYRANRDSQKLISKLSDKNLAITEIPILHRKNQLPIFNQNSPNIIQRQKLQLPDPLVSNQFPILIYRGPNRPLEPYPNRDYYAVNKKSKLKVESPFKDYHVSNQPVTWTPPIPDDDQGLNDNRTNTRPINLAETLLIQATHNHYGYPINRGPYKAAVTITQQTQQHLPQTSNSHPPFTKTNHSRNKSIPVSKETERNSASSNNRLIQSSTNPSDNRFHSGGTHLNSRHSDNGDSDDLSFSFADALDPWFQPHDDFSLRIPARPETTAPPRRSDHAVVDEMGKGSSSTAKSRDRGYLEGTISEPQTSNYRGNDDIYARKYRVGEFDGSRSHERNDDRFRVMDHYDGGYGLPPTSKRDNRHVSSSLITPYQGYGQQPQKPTGHSYGDEFDFEHYELPARPSLMNGGIPRSALPPQPSRGRGGQFVNQNPTPFYNPFYRPIANSFAFSHHSHPGSWYEQRHIVMNINSKSKPKINDTPSVPKSPWPTAPGKKTSVGVHNDRPTNKPVSIKHRPTHSSNYKGETTTERRPSPSGGAHKNTSKNVRDASQYPDYATTADIENTYANYELYRTRTPPETQRRTKNGRVDLNNQSFYYNARYPT